MLPIYNTLATNCDYENKILQACLLVGGGPNGLGDINDWICKTIEHNNVHI